MIAHRAAHLARRGAAAAQLAAAQPAPAKFAIVFGGKAGMFQQRLFVLKTWHVLNIS
jgi:hypothetical protein